MVLSQALLITDSFSLTLAVSIDKEHVHEVGSCESFFTIFLRPYEFERSAHFLLLGFLFLIGFFNNIAMTAFEGIRSDPYQL